VLQIHAVLLSRSPRSGLLQDDANDAGSVRNPGVRAKRPLFASSDRNGLSALDLSRNRFCEARDRGALPRAADFYFG
jgi:hypothetical protein